jgi:hypothetical protein
MLGREGWQCDEENSKRGAAWMDRLYANNMQGINNVFASQKDFGKEDPLSRDLSGLITVQAGRARR